MAGVGFAGDKERAMNEYMFQSRAMRILYYTQGVLFTVTSLVIIPWMLSSIRTIDRFFEPSPESCETIALLAQQAQQDRKAAETLRQIEETERHIAGSRRGLRLLLYTNFLLPLFLAAFGLLMIRAPIVAARRTRRRAEVWHTSLQGFPMYRSDLASEMLLLVYFVLSGGLALVILVFDTISGHELSLSFTVIVGLAISMLPLMGAHLLWRLHCRDWRIRLAEIPVRPGELVQFEIFRESGNPIDRDLCVELVGWQPKWNTKRDCYKSCWSLLLRTIPGEAHLDAAPGPAPGSIRGTLRFEGTNLVAVPPDGVKYPRRLLPFLRVRKGWWRRCLFDLPAPALYVRPEAARQSSVDERPSGH